MKLPLVAIKMSVLLRVNLLHIILDNIASRFVAQALVG